MLLVDFINEAVSDVMLFTVLNPLLSFDIDVRIFVDDDKMTILASLSFVKTSASSYLNGSSVPGMQSFWSSQEPTTG